MKIQTKSSHLNNTKGVMEINLFSLVKSMRWKVFSYVAFAARWMEEPIRLRCVMLCLRHQQRLQRTIAPKAQEFPVLTFNAFLRPREHLHISYCCAEVARCMALGLACGLARSLSGSGSCGAKHATGTVVTTHQMRSRHSLALEFDLFFYFLNKTTWRCLTASMCVLYAPFVKLEWVLLFNF